MSEGSAALSMINAVLGATVSGFCGLVGLEPFDAKVLNQPNWKPCVDFRGQTMDGRDLIIEVEARWDYLFIESTLLSDPAPFARSDFGGSGGGWISRVEDIYVIQFVQYDGREPEMSQSDRHSRVQDSVSNDGHVRIHVIQIELPLITSRFPVEAEIAVGWESVDWWYYLLKFSSCFNGAEIARCRGLGMDEAVLAGLKTLKMELWEEDPVSRYWREVNRTVVAREEFRSAWLEGQRIGTLQRLIRDFLSKGSVRRPWLKGIEGEFSRAFVRRVWDEFEQPGKSKESFDGLIAALEAEGLMGE
jgi:hypothetical protein